MKNWVHIIEISSENSLVTVTAKGEYKLQNIKDLIHLVIKDPLYIFNWNYLLYILYPMHYHQ